MSFSYSFLCVLRRSGCLFRDKEDAFILSVITMTGPWSLQISPAEGAVTTIFARIAGKNFRLHFYVEHLADLFQGQLYLSPLSNLFISSCRHPLGICFSLKIYSFMFVLDEPWFFLLFSSFSLPFFPSGLSIFSRVLPLTPHPLSKLGSASLLKFTPSCLS